MAWLASLHARRILLYVLVPVLLGGCATTADNPDPWEPMNRKFHSFNLTLDRVIMQPVAETYVKILPQRIRTVISNFYDNLRMPKIILNGLLQGKGIQALDDTGRFIMNSTLGIGGLFDLASDVNLPLHDEDFGQTFAVWGIPQGPYLELPFIGPSTTRDVWDIPLSIYTNPLNPLFDISSAYTIPVSVVGAVNARARVLAATRFRDESALDTYVFQREAFLQRRNFLIHDGNPPPDAFEDLNF